MPHEVDGQRRGSIDQASFAGAAAFFAGRLRPQVRRTSFSPMVIFGEQCFAASSACWRVRKLTNAHLDAVTRVMDLICSECSCGVRERNHSFSEASVVLSGRDETKSDMIDRSSGGGKPVAAACLLTILAGGAAAAANGEGVDVDATVCNLNWSFDGNSCLNGQLSPRGHFPLAYAEQSCCGLSRLYSGSFLAAFLNSSCPALPAGLLDEPTKLVGPSNCLSIVSAKYSLFLSDVGPPDLIPSAASRT